MSNENCTHDSPNSPGTTNRPTQLVQQIATDASHFYNQPKTHDLASAFQAIGVSLASGSKLVNNSAFFAKMTGASPGAPVLLCG